MNSSHLDSSKSTILAPSTHYANRAAKYAALLRKWIDREDWPFETLGGQWACSECVAIADTIEGIEHRPGCIVGDSARALDADDAESEGK